MQRALAGVLTIGAISWSAALFLSPYALTSRSPRLASVAALVYHAAGSICHQRPERSFHLAGVQQPVCGRCTALYVSGAMGAVVAWVASRRPRAPRRTRGVIVLAAIPTALSVALEFAGLLHSSNTLRAISALPLGAAAGWIFVQSLRAEAAEARDTGSYLIDPNGLGEQIPATRASDSARLRAAGASARSRRSFSGGGSEPRERSAPAKRRARERVGESEGRKPLG